MSPTAFGVDLLAGASSRVGLGGPLKLKCLWFDTDYIRIKGNKHEECMSKLTPETGDDGLGYGNKDQGLPRDWQWDPNL